MTNKVNYNILYVRVCLSYIVYRKEMIKIVKDEFYHDEDICPVCGERMTLEKELEIHTELDIGDPYRNEFYCYYKCFECGFSEND